MLTDTWVAGQASTLDLAAVAVGSNLTLIAIMFLYGFLMVLSPKVAFYQVSEPQKIPPYFMAARLLAALMSLAVILVMLGLIDALPTLLQQTKEIVPEAQAYLFWSLPGIFFASLYMAYRFTWEGLHYLRWTIALSSLAFLINIPLDWIFVLGIGDIPGLGGEGCGLASSLSFLLSALLAHYLVKRRTKLLAVQNRFRWRVLVSLWPALLRLGLPAALALLSEVALFMLLALLIAKFGVIQLAAHQIAINLTSMIYVLPLSFSIALSIEVGRAQGQKDPKKLKQLIKTGQLGAIVIGGGLGILILILHEILPRPFTTSESVHALASILLLYAAAYQITDALQMAYAGLLRGLGQTLIAFKTTLIAYWGVGLVGGYLLANQWGMQAEGYWTGLVLALGVNALLLGAYTHSYVKTRIHHCS